MARRKMRLSWQETHAFLDSLQDLLPVVPRTVETHEAGLILAARYRFSIWDAMVVASAMLGDCDTPWAEDMQHGLAVGSGLRILNPFAGDAAP